MKYTITINQHAVFINGLINKTDLIDWAIVDYLKDFALYKKAKKIVHNNEEYIWLNYNHLMLNLPLAGIRYKSKVALRIGKLRRLGLIKTVKAKDNTLYYTFTDKLIDICFAKQSDIDRLKKLNTTPFGQSDNTSQSLAQSATDPVTKSRTDPVTKLVTDPVTNTITAQYYTKITILNKDYKEKKNINFFNEK
ncbi:MAG: hypothetical protein ABIK33_05620 [candidate division WOR-3 bacterium]